MADHDPKQTLAALEERMADTLQRVERLRASKVEAGEAMSLAHLQAALATGLENLPPLSGAIDDGDRRYARDLAGEMAEHVRKEIARAPIIHDLEDVVKEAEDDLTTRVGRHRNPVKEFIGDAVQLQADIVDITSAADLAVSGIVSWASQDIRKETEMSHEDDLQAITTAIEQVGKQLSFVSTRQTAASGTSSGAGSFRSVTQQMTATLDALGMPHYGVQFSSAKTVDAARDTLLESLMAEFDERDRNGTTTYVLGEGVRTTISAEDGRLLAGAAKVAARRVRAEADNILDILDRLPDMTRFRTERGVIDSADARREVETLFVDLDEIMADPYGVNLGRAQYTIARIMKCLLDFFDYADLEPEFAAVILNRFGESEDFFRAFNLDEIAKRRTPTMSEEIEYEIFELTGAFKELIGDVLAPLLAKRGNAAARLELAMTVIYRSAYDLRDILVRTGETLDEQEVANFTTQISVGVQVNNFSANVKGLPADLTVGQLMDWITDVAEPFTGASFRASMRERANLKILRNELYAQAAALRDLWDVAHRRGFALSLPGPMHQLEVLRFQVEQAVEQAEILTGTNQEG